MNRVFYQISADLAGVSLKEVDMPGFQTAVPANIIPSQLSQPDSENKEPSPEEKLELEKDKKSKMCVIFRDQWLKLKDGNIMS